MGHVRLVKTIDWVWLLSFLIIPEVQGRKELPATWVVLCPVFFSSSTACGSYRKKKMGKWQWRALVKVNSSAWERSMILEAAVKNSQSFPWWAQTDLCCIVHQQYFHHFREGSDLASILSLINLGMFSKSSAIRINLIYCASAIWTLVSPLCADHVTMEESWHMTQMFL